MNFTLCKNRCNYTKRNKQSRNSPLSVQPFQNRTIPCFAPSRLTYERSVGFASLQSLWVFISGVLALLAPPVASTLSISTTFAKEHLSLALLAPPVAPNTSIPTTIAKPHYPSPRTTFLPYERSVGFASMPRQPFVPLHDATALCG